MSSDLGATGTLFVRSLSSSGKLSSLSSVGGSSEGLKALSSEGLRQCSDVEKGRQEEAEVVKTGSADGAVVDPWEAVRCFFFLGFRNFGGSTAQVELLRSEMTCKRLWLDEYQFKELLVFGKSIPGPTSVQIVAAMGSMWLGGVKGAFVAGFLFLLPGAVLTYLCALFLRRTSEVDPRAFSVQWFTEFGPPIHPKPILAFVSDLTVGFPPAALAYIVYHCLGSMSKMCVDKASSSLAIVSALAVIFLPPHYGRWGYPAIILSGGGLALLEASINQRSASARNLNFVPKKVKFREDRSAGEGRSRPHLGYMGISKVWGRIFIFLWLLGLLVLITIRVMKESNPALTVFNLFYRIGSMAFGDDYIIIANIHAEMEAVGTPPATILFLGLAVIHMLPGHIFLLCVFLGSYFLEIGGGALSGLGVALPVLCITLGSLAFWDYIRQEKLIMALLLGMKTAATGAEVGLTAGMLIQVVNGRGPLCVAFITVALVVFFKASLPVATALGALLGWCLLQVDVGGPYCWLPSYSFKFPNHEPMCLKWSNMQHDFLTFLQQMH